jgi:hypothetical protein
MGLKQTIKSNIVSTNNKYNLPLEKTARLISKGNKDNSYRISVVGSDGLTSVYEDVCIRKDGSDNAWKRDPKVGDYVYVKEDNGRFIITGIVEEVQNKTLESNIYTNVYNGASGGFMQ